MSRIGETFERLGKERRPALVIYVTAGDPDLESSLDFVLEIAGQGADIIELGIPFSDPFADGPDVQAAMVRARGSGTTLEGVFDLCRKIRAQSSVPLVLFGYYNPIYVKGCQAFAKEAAAAGADGVLTVDLPFEEAGELASSLREAGLDFITLVAPTSTSARIESAKKVASGFVYYVSLTGVTGAALQATDDVRNKVVAVRKAVGLPVAVGFGIKTPDQARQLGQVADGVVVGSAVIRARHEGGMVAAGELVGAMRKALE